MFDSMFVDSLDVIQRRQQGGCNRFKADLDLCFASRAPNAPVETLDDILRGRRFHPTVELRLRDAEAVTEAPEASTACLSRERVRADLRTAVVQLMESRLLDALMYPTWSNPPRLIGDLNTPHGDNSQLFAPSTGCPAMTVPMGYTRGGALPASLSFFGRAPDEARLIGYVCLYEQCSHQVRPPMLTISRLTSTLTTGEEVRASARDRPTRALEEAGERDRGGWTATPRPGSVFMIRPAFPGCTPVGCWHRRPPCRESVR